MTLKALTGRAGKRGLTNWYEIQDNIAYWREFETTKIVYPDITADRRFALDTDFRYTGDTTFLIPTHKHWLLGLLNSAVVEWYYEQLSPRIRGGFLRFKSIYVEQIPIPSKAEECSDVLTILSYALSVDSNPALEQLLNGLVYELYFPDELRARGITLFAATRQVGLPALAGLEGEPLSVAAQAFVREHLAPGHTLRVMLSDLQTLDVVRIIEGKA